MGRSRNPKRDEALRQYIKSLGKMKPKEIAEFLNIPPVRVRKWKTEDNWDGILALPADERAKKVPRMVGGPFGNKKAVGCRGGHGTIGNKNAVGRRNPAVPNALKTGEYSSICLDTLTAEERELYEEIQPNPLSLMVENVRLLKIRERRMMILREKLKTEKALVEETEEHILVRKHDSPDSPSVREITKRKQALADKIVAIEEALTRVQDKELRAVESLNKLLKEAEGKKKEENKNAGITFSFNRN